MSFFTSNEEFVFRRVLSPANVQQIPSFERQTDRQIDKVKREANFILNDRKRHEKNPNLLTREQKQEQIFIDMLVGSSTSARLDRIPIDLFEVENVYEKKEKTNDDY